MSVRTTPCPKPVRSGRLRKAGQFLDAATDVLALADDQDDIGDAYVTLCVHAGIAAADVLCCAGLGTYASGQDHNEAIAMLKQLDGTAAGHLNTLLNLKTKAGYTSNAVSAAEVKRAERAATDLVKRARAAHAAAG